MSDSASGARAARFTPMSWGLAYCFFDGTVSVLHQPHI
jgi:hypothetical protein